MKMLINGQPADAQNGAVIDVINPATGKVIDTVPSASKEDVDRAVAAAKKAQKEWAKVPVHERVEIMYRFIKLVERDFEDLARTLSNETGKPITEARAEIGNIPIAFKAFSERAKHFYGSTIPEGMEAGQEKTVLIVKKEPLGVVAAVIPFNFPCDLFDQKVAPALLTGNAVIVKPSTDNPLTLCKLSHLMDEAGVTKGAISIVTGRGSVTGTALTSNPDVHLVTLTGSTAVGIETAKICAENLTRRQRRVHRSRGCGCRSGDRRAHLGPYVQYWPGLLRFEEIPGSPLKSCGIYREGDCKDQSDPDRRSRGRCDETRMPYQREGSDRRGRAG